LFDLAHRKKQMTAIKLNTIIKSIHKILDGKDKHLFFNTMAIPKTAINTIKISMSPILFK
jgi:hypothetical protein